MIDVSGNNINSALSVNVVEKLDLKCDGQLNDDKKCVNVSMNLIFFISLSIWFAWWCEWISNELIYCRQATIIKWYENAMQHEKVNLFYLLFVFFNVSSSDKIISHFPPLLLKWVCQLRDVFIAQLKVIHWNHRLFRELKIEWFLSKLPMII